MYPQGQGGPPRHNQGYPVQYAAQTNSGQCRPGPGPLMNIPGPGPIHAAPGPIHTAPHSLLGPPPLLQPTFAQVNTVPIMVPMCRSSFLPSQPPQQQPVFIASTTSLSPSRSPHHTNNQGQYVPQENFQRGAGQQGGYFSPPSPQQSMVSGRYMAQGSTPSAPPPLFRPGSNTPLSKGTTIEDQKQLNKTEKENLHRMFGVVLQQHGPIEVTDSRLLSVFMGLSPWMRQGIKYLGGLKEFFRQGAIFKLDGDVVSLAWQEEEVEDTPNQSDVPRTSPISTKPKSPIPTKAKSPIPTKAKSPIPTKQNSPSPSGSQAVNSDNTRSKYSPKDRKEQSGSDADSEDEEDAYWEGEDQGWWLLDPLPGEEENWKQVTPLQGRMGGGYYEDFKKLEEKENKDPEEIVKKLVFTSTPSVGSTAEEEKKTSPPQSDSPTPWNWEESAIAQEAEAELRRESQLAKEGQQSNQSLQVLGEDGRKDDTVSCSSDAEGSTRGRRSSEDMSDGNSKEEECNRRSQEMIYRSGSLHQAEDDVIVLEDISVYSSIEEEEEKEEEEGWIIEGTDSAEDKSEAFTDALEPSQEETDSVNEGDKGMRVGDHHQASSPINGGEGGQGVESYAGDEVEGLDLNENATKEEMMSDVISKLINVAISEATSSEESDWDQSCKVTKSPPGGTTIKREPDLYKHDASQDTDRAERNETFCSTKMSKSLSPLLKSVRSIGVETQKPQQAHKAMCTKEIKTKSRKVNTPSISTHNRRVGTGDDPRIEQLSTDLAKETRRRRHLTDDMEDLYDKYDLRKKEYASETKELKRKLDQTSKDLVECQRKLGSKGVVGIVQLGELRKTNMELKDSESRLTAAKSKLARAEKENSNLTKELENTTRQLLDFEKCQAQKESNRHRSTSTGGLEPEIDPALEEENKLLKMRSRSAEQKVLELQYQYAMQSLNKALQESQYIFRMYGNSLLSSSHRELLRMKWMDYQMYIKEKTDEVATSYYSALKALHQDVPLADIPSLKTQHIETFNPYKQSPVKAGEFGYISAAAPGLTAPPHTTLPDPYMPLIPPGEMCAGGVDMNPSYPNPSANQAIESGLAPTSLGSVKAPPGLTGTTGQAPPGLSNVPAAAGSDLSMPFMQAQTQRSAPGKLLRRVPRKTPKAFLAANFMSSLQHTTKVYGSAAAVAPPPTQPQVGTVKSGRGVGVGRQSPASVHDWLDDMDTDNIAQNQVSAPTPNMQRQQKQPPRAPPGLAEPPLTTPMDTITTTQDAEGMDTQTTTGMTEQVMMAPPMGGSLARPAGIGRGRPLTASGMTLRPPGFPSMESQRGDLEAMDLGMRSKTNETADVASRLSDTTTTTSRTSSSSNSRSASPMFGSQVAPGMERLSRPPGSKRGSPAGTSPFKFNAQGVIVIERPPHLSGSKQESPAGAVAGSENQAEDGKTSPSPVSRPRPSSAGDALTESQMNAGAAEFTPYSSKMRSLSLGGGAVKSSNAPSTNQKQVQENPSTEHLDSAPNFKEGGSQGDSMANVPPRFRARQLRMPYHRGAEDEQGAGASSEGSGDRWTTKVSKRKRKVLNLVEQQTQLIKEYRHLARSCDNKAAEPSKGRGQSQGSLDKLVTYLSKQFKQMSRKELTDAILQVRLDHNGSLSGIAMGTIISEASSYLSRAEKKKNRKESDVLGMCAVCQDDLYGDPDERKLDCGHRFHCRCIKTWVNEEGTCPICRKHTLFPEDFPRLH